MKSGAYAYLDASVVVNGVNILYMSHDEIKELASRCIYYNFPEGSGPYREPVRVWPIEERDFDPLDYSMEWGWSWIE